MNGCSFCLRNELGFALRVSDAGTGFKECLLSGLCSVSGKKVLHVYVELALGLLLAG